MIDWGFSINTTDKDAWPKIPAGVLKGNSLLYGDFDECLSIGKVAPFDFGSRSCYFGLSLGLFPLPPHEEVIFSPLLSLGVSVSVPSSCDENQLDEIVNAIVDPLWTTRPGVTYCQKQQVPFSNWAIIAM